ncbi:50S ribosomal protein L29 [Candidatus Dojkabacteria bacterium]|nr:50S ribosomal protein L29 [Candidatus Dojkabacteria bacterium]
MKFDELRSKKTEELEKMVKEMEDEVSKLYLDLRMGKVQNVREPRSKRKELAVLKTIIEEKKEADNLKKDKKDAKN